MPPTDAVTPLRARKKEGDTDTVEDMGTEAVAMATAGVVMVMEVVDTGEVATVMVAEDTAMEEEDMRMVVEDMVTEAAMVTAKRNKASTFRFTNLFCFFLCNIQINTKYNVHLRKSSKIYDM